MIELCNMKKSKISDEHWANDAPPYANVFNQLSNLIIYE